MSVRRLVSVLSVSVVAFATSVAVAQPAKDAPPAPSGSPPPAAEGGEGSAVEMVEDPPSDMEGTDENPDAPRTIGNEPAAVTAIPEKKKTVGYPIEEALRPITLPQNMTEVSIDPHVQVSPFHGTAALRGRYGITRQVQLGLTYVLGGVYDDPGTVSDKTSFHPGKAVGVDVTILLRNFLGLKIGVPVYIDPVAVGMTIGVPMRFYLTEKFTLGGMDDLLTFKIRKFAPTFINDVDNARGAAFDENNTTQSRGQLRFSVYGIYQHKPNFALIGRAGVTIDDFSGTRNNFGYGGQFTHLRAGFQFTPRRYLDLGLSVGFDDVSELGSFSPAAFLAVRI